LEKGGEFFFIFNDKAIQRRKVGGRFIQSKAMRWTLGATPTTNACVV